MNKPSKEERWIEKQKRGINTKKIYKKWVKEMERKRRSDKKEERNRKVFMYCVA